MQPFRQSGITVRAYAQRRCCTQQATRRGVQDTQRASLAHVLIYCSMHTESAAICDAFGVFGA